MERLPVGLRVTGGRGKMRSGAGQGHDAHTMSGKYRKSEMQWNGYGETSTGNGLSQQCCELQG